MYVCSGHVRDLSAVTVSVRFAGHAQTSTYAWLTSCLTNRICHFLRRWLSRSNYKQLPQLYRKYGELGCIAWNQALIELGTSMHQKPRRGLRGVEQFAVLLGRRAKLPPPHLLTHQRFIALGLNPGCSKNATVVNPAGLRAMFVDGAPVIDQHRALASFVVSHDSMARHTGCFEQQCFGYSRESLRFAAFDMDKIGRLTTRVACSAGHICARGLGSLCKIEPLTEFTRRQVLLARINV